MNRGKMLGKTQLPYKLKKGMKPCNCPDCRQDSWGINTGTDRKAERRALRRLDKSRWRKEITTPEYDA